MKNSPNLDRPLRSQEQVAEEIVLRKGLDNLTDVEWVFVVQALGRPQQGPRVGSRA